MLYPLYWTLMAAAILLLDYATGSLVMLAVLLFFPVALASWFNGRIWGLALAITTPLVGFGFHFVWDSPASLTDAGLNTGARVLTFSIVAVLMDLVARRRREIRSLKGTLPTCAWCRKVRDGEDRWQPMEAYITARSDAEFSHGICPECAKAHFGECAP